MARYSKAKVSKRGLPGSTGRKAGKTSESPGRASQPKGKSVPIRSSGSPKTMSVYSGSSGRAIGVTAKTR